MNFDIKKYNLITSYQKDYVEKPFKRVPKPFSRQEFEDPIAESYRVYLTLEDGDIVPPNENVEQYFTKFKKNFEKPARIYFQEPVNKDIIRRNKITKGTVTEYQTSYCDIENDLEQSSKGHETLKALPNDAEICLTTYKSYHGNLALYHGGKIEKQAPKIRPDNLEIGTGDYATPSVSEYSRHIGKLGGFIVQNMYEKLSKIENS
ncbi:hypothetical protein Zmor_010468 [Zophobas morio]|uniref:Uncharacterized protein n=1 Tax=Zophobas morio TaxID=2755281 RepID=A0AA38MIV6_9CUCU|nr:hypothetical protein Zmor_010468 [Zophobas morio]